MEKHKVNILLVDDKPGNLLVLEQLLESRERSFTKAGTGEEALKLAFKKEFDLVVLDVQMPGMDGFEVAQLLKSNKRTRDIPIIFATAEKKEQKSMVRGIEEGAIDYLFKPLDPEITRAKVDVLLRLQKQKKELIEKNASLEKYALLINNCVDLICTLDAKTLKFEEVNLAFREMLGYDLSEIRNTSLFYYLCDESRLVVEQLRDHGAMLDFETRIYSKSREIKWLHWHVVVKDGKWYANARDITEGKQVEEIKSYLSTVVKQSADAIYLHDPEGRIISWNVGAERIYGYKEAEALKMNIWNVIPRHLLEEAQEITARIKNGETIPSLETKRITKHGKIIDVVFSASVVLDANSSLKSIAITERDVTEQKASENKINELNIELQKNVIQLEASNKDLESFSYSVSHDLRAPLRAIAGYSKIIQEDFGNEMPQESKKVFGNIIANAQKMGTLIDDLLEFSRLGRKGIKKSMVDMNELAKAALNECNSCYPSSARVTLHPLPMANVDYGLMNQVLINLLSNAIKYSSKKASPEVELGSREEENEIVFYVKDNGAGFNMKYIEKLFGVFQRLHAPSEFEGTGVGLAIVHRIISKHGGRIWAEGKVDEGAVFYFTLPK